MDTRVTAKPLKLAEFLPYKLSVLSNTVSKRIAEHYEAEFGINVRQWRVMAVLGDAPGLNATEISERTAMDKVAVSRAVASLVEGCILRREATQEDGRRSCLFLTAKGQDIYARIVPLALSHERELTQALADADVEHLKALLDSCAAVVSPDRALW